MFAILFHICYSFLPTWPNLELSLYVLQLILLKYLFLKFRLKITICKFGNPAITVLLLLLFHYLTFVGRLQNRVVNIQKSLPLWQIPKILLASKVIIFVVNLIHFGIFDARNIGLLSQSALFKMYRLQNYSRKQTMVWMKEQRIQLGRAYKSHQKSQSFILCNNMQ